MADSAIVIRQGEIVADGPIEALRAGAARDVHAVFAGAVPSAKVFSRLIGTQHVEHVGANAIRISWVGPPRELLEVLSRYDLSSLTAPEPNLETAFLSFYSGGGDGA